MFTRGIRRSLALVGVVAGLAVVVACGSSSSSGASNGSGGGYQTGPTQPTPTATADLTIVIGGMSGANSFAPNPGTLKAGQTVAWRNGDSIVHTATGNSFDTGDIAPGGTSAPITFNATGSIDYHCRIHPSMVGSLNVTQ